MARGQLGALAAFLDERIAEHVASGRFVPRMSVDGALALRSVSPELVELLERVGPYGVGNPEPRFVFPGVSVARADIVGEKHVRCFLADQQGGRLSAIAFRSVGTRLGDALLARGGAGLHLAGTLRADHWRGEMRVQFCIEDAAPVQPN